MADFVAVIRRAVDGLSDNTPEMRVKVYEKARSAVLRQLEGMKPRPPEEMLRRQLEKLETAIQQVEDEHQAALPAMEEEVPEPEIAVVPEREPMPEPAPAPVAVHPPEPEPVVVAAPEPVAEPVSEPVAYDAPVQHADEPVDVAPAVEMQQPVAVGPEPVFAAPEVMPAIEPAPAAVGADEAVPMPQADAVAFEPLPVVPPAAEPLPEPVPAQDMRVDAPVEIASPSAPIPVETVQPVVPAAPKAAPAGVFLFGDESWAGDEDEAVAQPEPAAQPVIPMPEPVALQPEFVPEPQPEPEPEPVAAPLPSEEPVFAAVEPHSAPAPEPDPYADFPIEEPTAKYSQQWQSPEELAAATVPETMDWPQDGMVIDAKAEPVVEEWTAEAIAVEEPIRLEPVEEPQPFSLSPESGHVDDDPFAWHPETHIERQAEPVAVVAPAEPVNNVIHADFSTHRQEPVLSHADETAADVVVEETPAASDPAPAEADLLADEDWDRSPFEEDGRVDPTAQRPAAARGWDTVDDFAAAKPGEIADPGFEEFDPDAFQALEKPARSYRIQPKRRFDFTTIGLGLLGLVIVAGAGYGAWALRDTLSGLVTGLVSNPPAEEVTKPSTAKPADNAAKPADDAAKPAVNAAATEPVEPDVQKFTQRLRADGTEVDEGKAKGTGEGEGKSVAPQTVASAAPETTPSPVSNGKVENPASIPVGVAQKMFLYEERVGQTSPVAIEGSVVWSLKTETGDNGKPETEVQGQVTTPERGLSALITFKRNFDPSLPASHLVELVFSLPANFDGGGIESVQRVAFKQTEQDRGDALVAVPAKITDDFHMIALNDFADARAFNLKLMQTRDWIDIPIAYRNGRRALLTMQKGTTGTEAFNQALAAWAAEEPAASAAPANPQ